MHGLRSAAGVSAILIAAGVSGCGGPSEPSGTSLSIEPLSGGWVILAPGSLVANPPTVAVYDPNGRRVPRADVTCKVTEGGGTISPSLVLSDTAGVARCTGWRAGMVEGRNVIEVSAGGGTAAFGVYVISPGPVGSHYDLETRGGVAIASDEGGYIELNDDGDFKHVYYGRVGTPFLTVLIGAGRYQKTGTTLLLAAGVNATINGTTLTLQYDTTMYPTAGTEIYRKR